MTESTMFKKLKQLSYYFEFMRIETITKVGVPDLYYCSKLVKDISGWIELKQGYGKKGVKIKYQPGQITQLTELKRYLTRVFVLIHYDKNFFLVNEFESDYQSRTELELRSVWSGKCLISDQFILNLL